MAQNPDPPQLPQTLLSNITSSRNPFKRRNKVFENVAAKVITSLKHVDIFEGKEETKNDSEAKISQNLEAPRASENPTSIVTTSSKSLENYVVKDSAKNLATKEVQIAKTRKEETKKHSKAKASQNMDTQKPPNNHTSVIKTAIRSFEMNIKKNPAKLPASKEHTSAKARNKETSKAKIFKKMEPTGPSENNTTVTPTTSRSLEKLTEKDSTSNPVTKGEQLAKENIQSMTKTVESFLKKHENQSDQNKNMSSSYMASKIVQNDSAIEASEDATVYNASPKKRQYGVFDSENQTFTIPSSLPPQNAMIASLPNDVTTVSTPINRTVENFMAKTETTTYPSYFVFNGKVYKIQYKDPTIDDGEVYDYREEKEIKFLEEKIKILQKGIEDLRRENAEIKQKTDEVEAIKMQIELSDRIREDMKLCKELEIQNEELKECIRNLYKSNECSADIKFKNRNLQEKYNSSPSFTMKMDEVDMYATYKNLVNYNDRLKGENIFLKIEIARLQRILACRSVSKTENVILKHEISQLKEKIGESLSLKDDSRSRRSIRSSVSSPSHALTTYGSFISSFHKPLIQNPFKSNKSSCHELVQFDIPSITPSEEPSIKNVVNRLEEILHEQRTINTHLDQTIQNSYKKFEMSHNPPGIYCKYFLAKRVCD